jgi:penicillin-binding protein 2
MPLKNEDNERARAFTRRALLLGGSQGLLFSVLAGRMYYLQILESDRYAMLAEDNRINLRLLPPPRGRIFDRFGRPLAANEQNYRVVLVREQSPDVARTLDALGRVIELSDEDYQRVLREISRKRAFVPVVVREHLTWQQVSRIEVNAPDIPGVSIEVGQIRSYPRGESMTHVLGYVAAVSEDEQTGDPLLELPDFRIGKQGIEKQYDTQLRGAAGTSHLEVNAVGRVIREVKREEGEPGRDLVLTIDSELQAFAHQRLSAEQSAAAVVMDIWNGDVLALSSTPGYDPNLFNVGLTNEIWGSLIHNELSPLTNKAIAGQYAPGSTFKMMGALAGLEAGIDPNQRVFCSGVMKLGNARFHCWKKGGHGWVNMYEGLQKSCDIFFYDLSRKIGIERLSDMARRFGLGAPVGVDLPGERPGLIPTRDWKLATTGEPWQGGETLVAVIGQGYVLTTPLQLAAMVARLGNGGLLVQPRLTRPADEAAAGGEAPAAPQPASLNIPEAHMRVVHTGMNLVTNNPRGTAYRARIEQEGWEMAGKTGTSQVRRITLAERQAGITKNEDLPWRRRDHALFVAFAPVHAPRYACAVVVEHGGGGSKAAAPIARDILIETQRRDPSAAPPLRLASDSATEKS